VVRASVIDEHGISGEEEFLSEHYASVGHRNDACTCRQRIVGSIVNLR